MRKGRGMGMNLHRTDATEAPASQGAAGCLGRGVGPGRECTNQAPDPGWGNQKLPGRRKTAAEARPGEAAERKLVLPRAARGLEREAGAGPGALVWDPAKPLQALPVPGPLSAQDPLVSELPWHLPSSLRPLTPSHKTVTCF